MVAPGGTVTYTLAYAVAGSDALMTDIVDVLPAGVQYVQNSGSLVLRQQLAQRHLAHLGTWTVIAGTGSVDLPGT